MFPGLRDGFFVEAGTCGGHSGSATLALERDFGWTGICVEPFEPYYQHLVAHRRCQTDDRALSDTTGDQLEFLTYVDDPARSGIRALNKNGSWAERNGAREEVRMVESVTLDDLLTQHQAPSVIQYLCLDVEGAELTVLSGLDFSRWTILALSVEGPRCDDFLRKRGYVVARNPFAPDRIDHYFLHPSIADQRSAVP